MRIVIGIEYQGSQYYGWQRQTARRSVQGTLEKVLSKVANEKIALTCAGRTDAGVHAQTQVAHFNTAAIRDDRAWLLGANTLLPGDISVLWVKQVSEDFHARYSAIARQYRYIIYTRLARPAILQDRVWWNYQSLDVKKMHAAAQFLVGEHDFNAFRAAACQSKSSIRVMEFINVVRDDSFIYLDIKGDAFLHHMVRNITGSLVKVGRGFADESWIKAVLAGRDRKLAGITAPAAGLYLVHAVYPEKFELPKSTPPVYYGYR